MKILLSPAEKEFLRNLIKGNADHYSYHYKKVLKRRILNKRKELTEDLHPSAALLHFNSSIQEHHHNYHPMVISDIRMPAMNGYEFIKQIKELDPNAKIIL